MWPMISCLTNSANSISCLEVKKSHMAQFHFQIPWDFLVVVVNILRLEKNFFRRKRTETLLEYEEENNIKKV